MAAKIKPWTEDECKKVEGILTSFNGAEEVCAVMGCEPGELDARCLQSFGTEFEDLMERYHTVGRSKLRQALFEGAMNGNAKALDTLAREQLGSGPVETRRRLNAAAAPIAKEVDF